MSRTQAFEFSSTALLLLAGCGSGAETSNANGRPIVPARGALTYLGAPLEGAIVVIQPTGRNGVGASALTDRDGNFDLKAFPPSSGAVPGSYRVTVIKMEPPTDEPNGPDAPIVQEKSLIPVHYGIPAESGLSAEIPPSGTESLTIELNG